MDAERYVKEKERLSLAMHSQDRLMDAGRDIMETLAKYNLRFTPHLAFDVFCFTLETQHLAEFKLPEQVPSNPQDRQL